MFGYGVGGSAGQDRRYSRHLTSESVWSQPRHEACLQETQDVDDGGRGRYQLTPLAPGGEGLPRSIVYLVEGLREA